MLSPNLKIASAVIGVGGVATGAGVGVYHGFIKSKEEQKPINNQPSAVVKKAIASLLNSDTKVLLEKNSDLENWNNNWKEFKKTYTKENISNSKWAFTHSWESEGESTAAPEVFKDKCLSNSQEQVEGIENVLFKEVEQYCTKNK